MSRNDCAFVLRKVRKPRVGAIETGKGLPELECSSCPFWYKQNRCTPSGRVMV